MKKLFFSFVLVLFLVSFAFSYSHDDLKCDCHSSWCVCYSKNASDNSFLVFCASQGERVFACKSQSLKCVCYLDDFESELTLEDLDKILESYSRR